MVYNILPVHSWHFTMEYKPTFSSSEYTHRQPKLSISSSIESPLHLVICMEYEINNAFEITLLLI